MKPHYGNSCHDPSETWAAEARSIAKANGHEILKMNLRAPGRWTATCKKCGMDIFVKVSPETGMPVAGGDCIFKKCDG